MRIEVDTREKPRAIVRIMNTFETEGIEVVRRALRAAVLGRALCIPSLDMKAAHVITKILPASVNVDGLSKVFSGHCRALYVPSRSAHSPWRFPCDLGLFLAGFPQSKIKRVFLDFTDSDSCAALKVVYVLS